MDIIKGNAKMKNISAAKFKCDACKCVMRQTKLKLEGFQIRAWKCGKCGETLLNPEDAQKMLVFNKLKKGLPVKVGSLGRSLILRIPKEVAVFYNISKGNWVSIHAEDLNSLKLALT